VSVIVIQFITLDGIVSDPDGSGGTKAGGWAFRHGPETVAGDIASLEDAWETIRTHALSQQESLDFIRRTAEEKWS
jgi:hypothetical protein